MDGYLNGILLLSKNPLMNKLYLHCVTRLAESKQAVAHCATAKALGDTRSKAEICFRFACSLGGKKKQTKGFTLPEILLSIALIGLLSAMSIPVYQSFQVRNDLDIATESVVHAFRRAQLLSQAVDGDISWGVSVQTGSIVIFKGVSYASRDASFDEIFTLPTNISFSGVSEVVYAKSTGLPGTTGICTLTSNVNETRTITINTKGMVGY